MLSNRGPNGMGPTVPATVPAREVLALPYIPISVADAWPPNTGIAN